MRVSSNGCIPTVTMGQVTLPLATAIILRTVSGTANGYTSMMRNGAAYQVPTGFKLVVVAFSVQGGAATTEDVSIGYGDTVVNGAAAPTNAVYCIAANSAGTSVVGSKIGSTGTVYGITEGSIYEEIPASKYIFSRQSVGNYPAIKVMGYLVAV